MKAMIFAAGFGTRLKPLTDSCPKALVKVGDKPMLQHTIEHLIKHNFDEIIVNIHYLGDQIKAFLQQHNNFGIRIEISDETDLILETGGGLLKAQHFFDDNEAFLVCNADVFTNINISEMYRFHQSNGALATLAVRNRESTRYLLFDDNNILYGWENIKTNVAKIPRKIPEAVKANFAPGDTYPLHEFAFSGYHIISPEIFKHQSLLGVFSMTDWYLDLCRNHTIVAYQHNNDVWVDIGSFAQLQKANELIATM
ncbi:MAG TPA: nucleotidyltransferase family protein [Chitinophagales bacterium]|nr:nucleotidyltransferase family protein [Chitinophagales bacterium]HRG35137.1 nucleotidyltransferase family protein [Chitinophagales bacterium]